MCAEPFEVSDDADSVQMLTRSSQIGEFYVMSPPQVKPMGSGAGEFSCDMLIYDEEADRHVRIRWEDALNATLIDHESGTKTTGLFEAIVQGVNADTAVSGGEQMSAEKDSNGNAKTLKASEWKDAAQLWSMYNKDPSDENWNAAKANMDIRIVVARPFIEHLMHNAILTVSGRDTGATLFGPADMQLSANTQVKTIEGACRARTRAPRLAPAAESAHHRAQATTRATSRPW